MMGEFLGEGCSGATDGVGGGLIKSSGNDYVGLTGFLPQKGPYGEEGT